MQLTFGHIMLNHHRWHPGVHLAHEEPAMLMKLYCVRVAALAAVTALWVMITLATGFLTVSMVILIGLAIGNAHHMLSRMPRRAHLSSTLLLTMCGGVVANVLAGLALYSSKMGVDYWQVLTARRIPEDLSMLAGVFAESYRPEDSLFYCLAVAASMLSARYLKVWHAHQHKGATVSRV
jgi:hypothetical protein